MLLADVLALASRKVSRPAINEMNSLSPRLLIDFATLTGRLFGQSLNIYQSSDAHVEYTSCQIVRIMLHGLMLILTSTTSIFALIFSGTCISSLSNRYIGAFTNRKEFSSEIIRAGEKCGERVWTFPLDEDFEEDLKSDIADILQVRAVLATVHSKHQQLI